MASPLKTLARATKVKAVDPSVAERGQRARRSSLVAKQQAVQLSGLLVTEKKQEKAVKEKEEEKKKGRGTRQKQEQESAAALKAAAEAAEKQAKADEKAKQEKKLLHVPSWEFVSPQAVEDEYVLTQASFVSIL